MHSLLAPVLDALRLTQPVDEEQLMQAFETIMEGACSECEMAALLTALSMRGETADQLAIVARVMRQKMTRILTSREGLVDTCGTGGDRLHTFNISTATAIIVAAGGVPVAKHGNRSVSSSSGSADVLEQLGVNIMLPPEMVGRCLDEVGLGFCFARSLHTAMRHVAPVRAALGFRTIFNLVGPLTNPAGAEYQLIGANSIQTAELLAQALARLGIRRAFVVCGGDQLDEIALWNVTTVFEVTEHCVEHFCWNESDFGLPACVPEELRVTSAAESAAVIRQILANKGGPARDVVLANSAAAFLMVGKVRTLPEGVQLAASVVDSGAAGDKLQELVAWTSQHAHSEGAS